MLLLERSNFGLNELLGPSSGIVVAVDRLLSCVVPAVPGHVLLGLAAAAARTYVVTTSANTRDPINSGEAALCLTPNVALV